MRFNKNKQQGFTIVELLIVIVVIAILAAITIVAYNGIQNRANDTAVRTDVSNMAKKLQLFYVEKNIYPDTNIEAEIISTFQGFKASQSAYFINGSNVNLVYCTNLPDKNQFAVIGWSKTSNTKGFYVTNTSGVKEFPYPLESGSKACDNAGISASLAWMWMYDKNTSGGWRSYI